MERHPLASLPTGHPAQRAFTLLEVVMVMAIIAILALMTLPFFAGNTARTQIKESMELADLAKRAVATYYASTGQVPANNEAARLPEATKIVGNYVSAVTVVDGAVNMKFGNNAHPKIKDRLLSFRPAVVQDARQVPVAWVCGGRPVPSGMEVVGTNATNLSPDALPPECR